MCDEPLKAYAHNCKGTGLVYERARKTITQTWRQVRIANTNSWYSDGQHAQGNFFYNYETGLSGAQLSIFATCAYTQLPVTMDPESRPYSTEGVRNIARLEVGDSPAAH